MAPPTHPLPLSWTFIPKGKIHARFVSLFHLQWLSLAQIPQEMDSGKWFNTLLADRDSGLLIRGCNTGLRESLRRHGFTSLYVGQEAVLDLQQNGFNKKSLRLLVDRGKKHGRTAEIPFTKTNIQRIEALKLQTRYGRLPQLHHLFENTFEAHTRCFVFESQTGEWLAALSVSQRGNRIWQTELLLRRKNAPNGVMEALIRDVFTRLKKEGNYSWSLGEVPFLKPDFRINRIEEFLIKTGQRLHFAYNSQGLFRFKNKFNPQWKPVYICANRNIGFFVLGLLFLKTNFFRLVFAQMAKNILQGKILNKDRLWL